jgi:hypothetical protein
MDIKNIEVDVTDSAVAIADAEAVGVRCWVIAEDGPGGGNPLVAVEGDRDKVIALLKTWGYDADGVVADDRDHAVYIDRDKNDDLVF